MYAFVKGALCFVRMPGYLRVVVFYFCLCVEGPAVLRPEFDMCSLLFVSFLGCIVQERVPYTGSDQLLLYSVVSHIFSPTNFQIQQTFPV